MDNRDILAIGTSAGGFDALRFLVSRFPENLAASVLITIHLHYEFPSQLDRILTSAGPMRTTFAIDKERFEKGRVYLAPPGHHLLVDQDRLQLGVGPRENHARPAIDPMLRSLAVCCGARAIGVVLTGMMNDGAAGLCALKECGGLTVVQDPSDAAYSGMPKAALRRSRPDFLAPLRNLPALLEELVRRPRGAQKLPSPRLALEVGIARGEQTDMTEMDALGACSTLTCPNCGGVLWEIGSSALLRYRCHLGHACAAELVDKARSREFNETMSTALRTLREQILLAKQLETQAIDKGWEDEAGYWRRRVRQGEEEIAIVSEAIRKAYDAAGRDAEPQAPDTPTDHDAPEFPKNGDQSKTAAHNREPPLFWCYRDCAVTPRKVVGPAPPGSDCRTHPGRA